MIAPTPEERSDALLRLLEQHRDLSDRLEVLSEAEVAEYRGCCKQIEELIMQVVMEQTAEVRETGIQAKPWELPARRVSG